MPYQSAVVFAVLVGQVCNGGRNAGTEELLSLVKVALMDFIQELMVSVNINIKEGWLHLAVEKNKTGMLKLLIYSGEMLILTLESSRLAVLSVQSGTERKNINENVILLQNIIYASFQWVIKTYTHSNFRCSCSKLNVVKCKGIVCVGQAHWILRETKK